MGRQHPEKLLVAVECKTMEETNREQGYLETSYRRGPGSMRAVVPLRNQKKNKKHKPSKISKCPQNDNR
jgi:hypothetical protein